MEYQDAIAHKDTLIQHLTESLQQSLHNKEELQQQSENFAREISQLQKQLTETSNIIKRHKCSMLHDVKHPVSSDSTKLKKMSRDSRSKDNSSVSTNSSLHDGNSSNILEALDDENNVGFDCVVRNVSLLHLNEQYSKMEKILSDDQLLPWNEFKTNIDVYMQQRIEDIKTSHYNEIEILKVTFLYYNLDCILLKDQV